MRRANGVNTGKGSADMAAEEEVEDTPTTLETSSQQKALEEKEK